MHGKLAIVLLSVAAVAGCGSGIGAGSGLECPTLAVRGGIGVDIDPAYAPKVTAAKLTTCWDTTCKDTDLVLDPSSRTQTQTCTGTGPDAACGAQAIPTGGKNGFADLMDMPAAPVKITLVLSDSAGARLSSQSMTITPKVKYPAGPECGGGTPQGGVIVSPGGTLSERP